MWRIWIALIVFGGMACFWGCNEFRVSVGTSAQPVAADLAALEKGTPAPNNHMLVGEHVCVYPETVYECSLPKHGSQQVSASTTVNCAYYPILSKAHPFLATLAELKEKHGSFDKVPQGSFPAIGSFSVLVKTTRFRSVGTIPDGLEARPSVQGLVINRIKRLSGEERRLVQESFPKMDLDRALILEEGRKPSSSALSLGAMLAGLLLIGVGVGLPLAGKLKGGGSGGRNARTRRPLAGRRPIGGGQRPPQAGASPVTEAAEQPEDEQPAAGGPRPDSRRRV